MAPSNGGRARYSRTLIQRKQLPASEGRNQQQFPCTYAADFSCTQVYDSQELASAHAILDHAVPSLHKTEHGRFKCPFTRSNCQFTANKVEEIREHGLVKHSGERVPCPLPQFRCWSFTNTDGMFAHVWQSHKVLRIPCPYLWIDGCDKTYGSREAAETHVRNMHREKRYPCRFREKFVCFKEFTTPQQAIAHSHTHRHPCPLKEVLGCLKEYGSDHKARLHAKTHGDDVPCPRADELTCIRKFRGKQAAERHAETHDGKKFACPGADEFGCDLRFSHWGTALSHHRKDHTRTFKCQNRACTKRFETEREATEHSESEHQLSLFLCPLENCHAHVSGIRYSKHYVNGPHRDVHIRDGQIDLDDDFLPIPVAEIHHTSETRLYQLILQQGGSKPDNSNARDSDDSDNESQHEIDSDNDDDDLLFDSEENSFTGNMKDTDNERGSEKLEFLPEYRRQVETGNTAQWDRLMQSSGGRIDPSAFKNLGLKCLGPMPTKRGLVLERCPYEAKLDFDTAKMRSGYNGRVCLTLPNRCASCESDVNLRAHLERLGWEFDESTKTCKYAACTVSAFHGTGMCVKHLARSLPLKSAALHKIPELQDMFSKSVQKTWTLPLSIRRSLADVQEGKMPGAGVIVLDIEFSPSSGQVWEVSMIEQISGNILLNTTIKHNRELDHGFRVAPSKHFHQFLSRKKAKMVYSSPRQFAIDHMDVHQVAARLQEIDINQNTIFLTWHNGSTDLILLRRFLTSAGYQDLLPEEKNCLPLIPILRPCFPDARSFSMKLEVLFPVIFPRHHLIGLNHQALVDCQQTRLILQAALELTKPIGERGKVWNSEVFAKTSQTSIYEWLTNTEVSISPSQLLVKDIANQK